VEDFGVCFGQYGMCRLICSMYMYLLDDSAHTLQGTSSDFLIFIMVFFIVLFSLRQPAEADSVSFCVVLERVAMD